MTLRLRLVLTLVLLATAGLLVVGAATYTSQRTFQLQRIDQQTQAAEPALDRKLDEMNGNQAPYGGYGKRGGPAGGPDPSLANLPPGTYGVLRDASGRQIGKPATLTYDQTAFPAPKLPADLAVNTLRTVDAVSTELQYRVRVLPARGGAGTIVIAIPLAQVDDALDSLLLVLAVVIGAVVVLLAGLAWLLVGRGLRPLQRMGDTAGAIVAGDLGRRVEDDDPRTEVGRLGVALNGMLARIEQAFAEREASEGRLRQFLSDASHELRTPLASIRGYAELFRMGALQNPDDAQGALQRIEDEAARMGVLVEDLLVLARLDEVREPVRVEVDLGELALDAIADARATAPERTVTAEGDAGALVEGDPDQLRQVLANLVRNALVHTPAAAAIEVRAHREPGRVRLTVRDHGPGLPPGDPARLFDRFWRSEAGRRKGRAGAGLGLAIVSGIVHAHGGTVRAGDAAGGGAEFVVELPAAAQGAPSGSVVSGRAQASRP